MPKLYALLVGINEYAPKANVRRLYGCIKDVEAMHQFLKAAYGHLLNQPEQIKTLTNAEATRVNLINTFSSHLGQAGPEDFILFYYSGHGSYEPTSEAFIQGDALEQNETLVCYDSRLPGGFDLADKELAVLISRMNKEAQKIIILDSCHSGSATRSSEEENTGRKRQIPSTRFSGSGKARKLADYLLPGDNYYQDQWDKNQRVEIPEAKHIVLSACSRQETALETAAGGGIFSKSLLDVLKGSNQLISYDQLFTQIHTAVRKTRWEQTPQLMPVSGFDTRLPLFGKEPVDRTFHIVEWQSMTNQWQLSIGAVHGLPTESTEISQVQVRVYPEFADTALNGGEVLNLTQVNFDTSSLDFPNGDTQQRYQAEIIGLPRSKKLSIYLNAPDQEAQTFRKLYQKRKSAYLEFLDNTAGCTYELRINGGLSEIFHLASGRLIQGVDELSDWGCKEVVKILNHIERWERVKKLHRKPKSLDLKEIPFKAYQLDVNSKQLLHQFSDNKITLELSKQQNAWSAFDLRITVQNQSEQQLYVQALYMSRFYQIMVANKEVDLPAESREIDLFNFGLTIGEPSITQVVDVIKVVISTTPLNAAAFNQEKLVLGDTRSKTRFLEGANEGWDAANKEADWFTHTFYVSISGVIAVVGTEAFTINQLSFLKHTSFSANLSFAPLNAHYRNANPINVIPEKLQGLNFELLNFSTDPNDEKSVIVLSDIKNIESLRQEPLRIEVSGIPEGETLLPLSCDGQHLLPFGSVKREGKKAIISFSALPAQPDTQRRDTPQSLEFVLAKYKLSNQDNTGLSWIDYSTSQREARMKADLNTKVEAAQKILLLLPGLTENVLEMVDGLRFLEVQKKYDLTLAYDYPEPTASTDTMARQLQEALSKAGLPGGAKKVTLMAHGLGGLVAHQLAKQPIFEKVILVGAPKNGVALADLAGAKGFLLQALAFSLNYRPGKVPAIMRLWHALNQENAVSAIGALADADQNSLASSFTEVTYINGQLKAQPTDSNQQLLLTLKEQVEALTNVKPLAAFEGTDVDVYHFNYFNDEKSIALIQTHC